MVAKKKTEEKEKNNLIKSVKKLPAWFKLENYNHAKKFTAGEWYDELIQRLHLRYFFKLYKKSEELPLNWKLIKKHGLLFHVAKNEEVKYRISALTPDLHHFKEIDAKKQRESECVSVESVANFHVYGSYLLDDEKNQAEIAKMINVLLGEEVVNNLFKMKAALWVKEYFADFPMDKVMGLENKYGYARVDLDASDEQIKKDFVIWLDRERDRRSKPAPKKNFNQVDFDSWHEGAILPYLDLMFWAELEGVKITQYTIVQAIYSDAYGADSDVDPLGRLKTTKKKAEYLMEYKAMKLLELQIPE